MDNIVLLAHAKAVHNHGSRESHGAHAEEGKEGVDKSKHAKGLQKPMKHEGYDKKSGTGHGKDVKKGGHGKGGWGDEDYDKLAKNHSATEAAELIAEDDQNVEVAQEPVVDNLDGDDDKKEAQEFHKNDEEFPSLGQYNDI